MDELGFHKMHSLGNDFVIIDRRSGKLSLSSAQIRLIADRRRGVGCDQLLALEPSGRADLFMRVYNPDGSEAEACGNGTRCVARMIMEQDATTRVRIETRADVLVVSAGVHGYTVDMGRPRFAWDEIPLAQPMDTLALDLALGPLAQPVALSMGNPHAVFLVDDAEAIPLDPDVVLVPLTAFDRRCRRIGYGAGYYDRTLSGLRKRKVVIAVGIAFAVQEVEAIPVNEHDQRLDLVLTEREIVDFRSS